MEIDKKAANARRALEIGRAAKAAKAAPQPVTFKVEVQTGGPRSAWAGNMLRFAKEADAQSYGADLFTRWTSVTAWRIGRTTDPATHRWNGQMAEALAAEECAA